MTLLFLAYYDMTLQAADDEGFLTNWHIDIVLCRVMLGFLAHLQTEPEVRQAIKMLKYALNHGKAKGSVIDLYKKTCGKRFPLPENPQELTNKMLAKAYRHFKEYHRKLPIPCRHEIPSDVEFLLDLASQNYHSREISSLGFERPISIRDKLLKNRKCKEDTISRDELYEIFKYNNYYYPHKRADDLFFRSNTDGDSVIDCDEFIEIYYRELHQKEQKRKKLAENLVRLKNRERGMCTSLSRMVFGNYS